MLHPQAEIYVAEKLVQYRDARLERPYNRRFPSLAHAIVSWRSRNQPPAPPSPRGRSASRPARVPR